MTGRDNPVFNHRNIEHSRTPSPSIYHVQNAEIPTIKVTLDKEKHQSEKKKSFFCTKKRVRYAKLLTLRYRLQISISIKHYAFKVGSKSRWGKLVELDKQIFAMMVIV